MADEYEVKVTIGDATVEVRGAQKGVVEIVKALSEALTTRRERKEPQASDRETVSASARVVDAQTFFRQKSPSTQIEAVTVAAYYLRDLAPENMRTDTIDAARATEVFRQARYRLPTRMRQVLFNAQTSGYLDRSGTGEYRINPVGYNLVVHTLGSNE